MTDTCGCCEAPVSPTPKEINNRPGLSAVKYRVGDYASFRQAMIEAIAHRPELRDENGVLRWTVRTSDDYGIALLEMWAYLADILTFYQERIANEAFLRTALLRESVLRLTAMLDYKPAPGVAAAAYLAFTLEKNKQTQIPVGLRMQSVPGQGEKPQKFETVEAITADARLNQLRVFPKPRDDNPLAQESPGGTLHPHEAEAIAAELAPGDKLVVFARENAVSNPDVRRGERVIGQRRKIEEKHLAQEMAQAMNTPLVGAGGVEEKEIEALKTVDWRTILTWSPAIQTAGWTLGEASMFKWLRKFRLFGYDAPQSYLKAEPRSPGSTEVRWTQVEADKDEGYKFNMARTTKLNLDTLYNDLKVGVRILISAPDLTQLTSVTAIDQVAVTKGPLSATITQITLADSVRAITNLRQVTVYELTGPEITFWNRCYDSNISGNVVYIPLDELDSLESKRTLILNDEQQKPQTVTAGTARSVDTDGDGQVDHLAIPFTPALARDMDTQTAVLYGNVAQATHGETVAGEVLGSGDASTSFQSFSLKKSPVTFVPQAGASHGAANTLGVRVDGVLWREVGTLYGHDGDERIYTTKVDDESVTTVQFGDGITGTRLLTGRNNVIATYRQGLGQDGNVKANSLTTLLDRPLGLKGVTNLADAQGGADPETLNKARTNAPKTVHTFGRIVSLRDFEDAAREFAGVAKARATWMWDGGEPVAHLIVAGDAGDSITGLSYKNLVADLNSRRDPNRKLVVDTYREIPVQIEAVVQVDPDYTADAVQTAAQKALLGYFAFDNLEFGQPIHLSDIYRVLQNAKGVVGVDVNRLQFKNASDRVSHSATAEPVQEHLRIDPAELAVIKPSTDANVKTG